jgi:hypothetical protein
MSITSVPRLPESIGNSIGAAPLSKVMVALVGLFMIEVLTVSVRD